MPKPVTVTIDVPHPREAVYAFLDVMANHEPFTNHALVDWSYAGPAAGVGSRAEVTSKAGPVSDRVTIEVIEAEPGRRIVERNVGAGGRRVATGTYELTDTPGGTRISFTYAWQQAPFGERVAAPLVRAVLRRINERAMQRLAEQLPAALATARPAATTTATAASA